MKTLLLSEIFPPRTGGSGRWFWELYRRLPADRFVVATSEHEQAAAFDSLAELEIHRLPLTLTAWGLRSFAGARGYWRAFRALRRLVRREKIDRIHCGRCLPEGWLAWMLRRWCGLPYDCYVHGEDVGTAASSRELSWMVRRVFNSASALIANSHSTAGMLRDHWARPAEQVHALHPGVDMQRFQPAPRSAAIRDRLGWTDRCVVLTVGRLQRRKGQDVLIQALPLIRRRIPNVLYAIVGTGEEQARLCDLASSSVVADHVEFLGEIDDRQLLECYQQCDLFVLPNRSIGGDIEGFGMVLVEAQACGKPVVAGASGGTAETMQVPETGRIVNCESPGPLADVLIDLLNQPRVLEAMGQRARVWVQEQFDWDSLVQRAATLFGLGELDREATVLAEVAT
jgi:phosphatidylinositol alpha-1,6-mannosyltransferase